jgi:hypothetical protein
MAIGGHDTVGDLERSISDRADRLYHPRAVNLRLPAFVPAARRVQHGYLSEAGLYRFGKVRVIALGGLFSVAPSRGSLSTQGRMRGRGNRRTEHNCGHREQQRAVVPPRTHRTSRKGRSNQRLWLAVSQIIHAVMVRIPQRPPPTNMDSVTTMRSVGLAIAMPDSAGRA